MKLWNSGLARHFLGYFLRLYLLVLLIGAAVASLNDAPQKLLLRRTAEAELGLAVERVWHQLDGEASGAATASVPRDSGLERSWGRHRYSVDPPQVAQRLASELAPYGYRRLELRTPDGAVLARAGSGSGGLEFRYTTSNPKLVLVTDRVSAFTQFGNRPRAAVALLAVLLFPFFTAWAFARHVARPLGELEQASRRLAAGDFSARAEVLRPDELGQLAQTINWMAAQLEERENLKTMFLATVSHELRTPLTAILGQSQMLLDGLKGPLTDSQRATVEKAARNAQALLSLIEDLLDLTRLQAGRMSVQREEFNLRECLEDAAVAVEPQFGSKGLAFEVNGSEEAWVYGDYARTRQILVNVLGNAVKFTDSGGVTVEVTSPGAAAPQVGSIAIRDTGPGIPAELHDAIFDEFRQADSGVARRFGGSGLGLAIARKLARLQGGELSVTSREGEGSTFTLTLPAGEDVK